MSELAADLVGSARPRIAFQREAGQVDEAVLADLGPGERAALEPLLERIVTALADDRPQALRVCRLCDRDACQRTAGCPLDHTTV